MIPTASIQELCEVVTSGGTPSRKHREYFSAGTDGHLWVKSKELLDGSISDTDEKITEEGLRNSSAKYLPAKTVLMAMYGANVGQLGWLKRPATVNQAVCGMVVNDRIAHFRYVFYTLLHTRDELAAKAQGAAQQNLNQGLIREFEIPTPPLAKQRRIASILSAYDDLIENNTRRIAILEEMARAIYQEWFVNFRFPGHEKVRMVESELGLIPEGWEVISLGDKAHITMGQSPKSEFYNDVGEGLPFHQGVTNFGVHFPTHKLFCTVTGRVAEPGDVLLSVRAPVGRINSARDRVVVGRGLSAIRRNDGFQTYLLFQLKNRFAEEDTMGSGTIFNAVTKKDMHNLRLIEPTEEAVARFEAILSPFWSLVATLTEKNENLRAQRDLLLPKLISGKIDVSDFPDPPKEEAA